MAKTSRHGPGLNMIAGHVAKPVAPAQVQGGTRTLIAPKGGSIKNADKGDSGVQGGTDTLRKGSKGGSALMVAPRSVRNSHFGPGTGSRGTSKVKGGSSAQSTEGRD